MFCISCDKPQNFIVNGLKFNPHSIVTEDDLLQKAGTLDVVADDRERVSGVIEHLQAQESIRVTVRRLELGDYLVNQRVLIERKTVADLSVSIVDGRLFRQACLLAESPYRTLLVIEGHVDGANVPTVSREAIQGAIVTLALFLDIPCLRSFDARETANLIRYAGEQIQRHISRAVYRHGYRPKRRRNRQLFILQGLPGIGPARAERMLDTFGSVENVFRADVDALARVEGIGRKTAEAIRELIGVEGEKRVPDNSSH